MLKTLLQGAAPLIHHAATRTQAPTPPPSEETQCVTLPPQATWLPIAAVTGRTCHRPWPCVASHCVLWLTLGKVCSPGHRCLCEHCHHTQGLLHTEWCLHAAPTRRCSRACSMFRTSSTGFSASTTLRACYATPLSIAPTCLYSSRGSCSCLGPASFSSMTFCIPTDSTQRWATRTQVLARDAGGVAWGLPGSGVCLSLGSVHAA